MAQPLHFDAINPFTGKPFTYDDPNLRFINGIGMYLEPSDPEFTPYPSLNPPQQPPKKTKKMKHNTFYPIRIADQILWLDNFRNKLLAYIAALGIDSAVAAAIIADCRWLMYVLGTWLPAARAWALACTDASAEAQTGTGNAAQVLPVFTAPALPAGVAAVDPGALTRIFALVQLIKDSAGNTDAIDSDLRIVGSVSANPDLAAIQPILTARINGTHTDLGWGWGGHRDHVDLLLIQVDRADGKGWVELVHDTTPNYTDTTAFPATATIWKYRAIFYVNDAPVGLWSNTVSVAVGG
jgi:hypothetical protein